MQAARDQIKLMAIVCVSAFVFVNLAFYFLSVMYFDSHHDIVAGVGAVQAYSADQMTHVRLTFVLCSGVIAAFGFAAGIQPRVVGHLIPVLLGVIDLVAAVAAFTHHTPAVVGMTLLVSGALLPVLARSSFQGSRPAWAFLVAICGVFAVVELFGAAKVRNALDIGLWTAMILPGVNAVAVAALASLRGDYVERAPVAA